MIKIYECAICKKLSESGIKGEMRFRGIRKEVRKHLTEVHRTKGEVSINKKDVSATTNNTLSEVWK